MQRIPEFILLNKYSNISFGLKNFLKGEISEEDYINTRRDPNGRVIYPWPELVFLRIDMDLYAEYLLKLSIYGRRLLLLEEEVTGFTRQHLYGLYGIPNDTIGRYLRRSMVKERKKFPPQIRDMTPMRSRVPKEVIAFFAILARVPISWLEEEKPEMEWSVSHFNLLQHAKMSLSEFKHLLENYSSDVQHDVRGIIINEGVKLPLYLRLERYHGCFIIELFNPNNRLNDQIILENLLKDFRNVEAGYMDTVINSQKNTAFIITHSPKTPICLPIEYKRRL